MAKIKIDSRTSELESGVAYTSFDKALAKLKRNSFEVISLPQNAELRIKEGKNAYVFTNGNYVREAEISIPNKGIYLVRNSPLLQLELSKEAVKAHRQEEEYSIESSLAKEYSDKASDAPEAEVFHLTDLEAIKTNKFDTDKRALWLFQTQSENYGKFLYDSNIKEMPLWFNSEAYINSQKSPFINQLWLHGSNVEGGYGLIGFCRRLDYDSNVRGVRPISGKASSQKITEENFKIARS